MSDSSEDDTPATPATRRFNDVPSREKLLERQRQGNAENANKGVPVFLQLLTGTLPLLLVSLLAAAGVMYYTKLRIPAKPPALIGITSSVVLDSDIMAVYDYVSTPDLRTEWHMGAVEVSGPAIDHSAVVGEQFVEELMIDHDVVVVDWSVVDREFPTSISTANAVFVVEGAARVEGKKSIQSWRETVKLRAGIHQFAKTPQVHLDMEFILDGGKKGGINGDDDTSKKWRKRLRRHMKDSLVLLRSRVEEQMQEKQRKSQELDAQNGSDKAAQDESKTNNKGKDKKKGKDAKKGNKKK